MQQQQLTLPALLQRHIDSHMTLGVAWPDDAEIAVVYKQYNWPTYNQREYVAFFSGPALFQVWYDELVRWSALEDNYFSVERAFRWDLGPEPVATEMLFSH